MGTLSNATISTINENNLLISTLMSNKDKIESQLLAKGLVDKSAIVNYFYCSSVRTQQDPNLNWVCCTTFNFESIVSQWRRRIQRFTDYAVSQSRQVALSQSSKSSYLLAQTSLASSIVPVNVTARMWTFYHFGTGKMHLIFSPAERSNAYQGLSKYDLQFIDLVQLLNGERGRGFYENDNELTFHGYFSTTAFLYLNNLTDPLSSNPLLTAGGQFQYHPGYNKHAMWGSDARRREWQDMGGNALMFAVNDWRKGHKKGTRFFGGPYSSYPFLPDGLYTMTFPELGKSSYGYCMVSFPISQEIFLNNKFGLINCIESELKNRAVIPNDVRIINPEESIITSVCLGTSDGYIFPGGRLSPGICGKYFEFEMSNTFTPNTIFASDSTNQLLRLPPAKLDEKFKPVRRYVRITKLSHETLSGLISKKIALQKITEVIPQAFSYPFSSIVGTKIDSRAFSQVPNRTFECKLKKILVPSNYFITNDLGIDVRYLNQPGRNQIYIGDWDGTFKLAWSNNPAWILMDLLVNKRYGLGTYIESEQIDIWELYKISRWCDCVDDNGYYYGVEDSYGGTEPRHTFNALIQEKFNIFDMINQVASVFRGHVYYMNSLITFDDDRLKPIIGEFNNSDVKDGLFNYTNHRKDEEFTAVDVSYIDEKDNYKPKLEYVEDSEGIRTRGILKKEINAFGITSRGQARRFGYHFLYQKSKENLNVSFTTDLKALLYKPGDLVTIHDDLMNSNKNYGAIKSVKDIDSSTFEVIIDKKLDDRLFNTREISIFTPIAKPKFDDISTSCQFIPTEIKFNVKNLINLGDNVCGYLNAGYFLPQGNISTETCAQSFEGAVSICLINSLNQRFPEVKQSATLSYIKDYDINNVPSKYGHWKLCILSSLVNSLTPPRAILGARFGYPRISEISFDAITDANIKYQLPHKFYFFEYFDIGVTCYLSSDGMSQWTTNLSKSQVCDISFQITDFQSPKISYLDILENDRPSVETFYIKNFVTGGLVINNELHNEYTCLTLYKGGLSAPSDTVSFSYGCSVFLPPLNTSAWLLQTGNSVSYPIGSQLSYVNNLGATKLYQIQSGSGAYELNLSTQTVDVNSAYGGIMKKNIKINGSGVWQLSSRPNDVGTEGFTWTRLYNKTTQEAKNLSFADSAYYSGTFNYAQGNYLLQNIDSSEISTSNKNYDINDIQVGSSYSLKLLNKTPKMFKIMSITENYVNEYNITATEFNPTRFKEIEENNSIDDLATTFNASYLHNISTSINSAGELKAPVILDVDNVANIYLFIYWRLVDDADYYRVFIKTPSKSTPNYITDHYPAPNSLTVTSFRWAFPKEIGTYTIYIESVKKESFSSMYKFSPPASYSINYLSY